MLNYRREIDGLRALAVVPVILFHAGFDAFSGGFVGVDVFFVISGFLITSIILTQKAAGTFSPIHFYERRARRILPALFVVIAACIPFAWMWLLPEDLKDFSQSLVAVSVFSSNILFWFESGYFDTAAELKPLLHTWSLAVEEQYYLLFPLFLLVVRRFAKQWTVPALAVITALSFAIAEWGAYNKPAASFFLLPTRAWEIAIGAFLAFYFERFPKQQLRQSAQEVGGVAGLLLITYAVFSFSKETPFPSTYTLAPALGAALIILCATPKTVTGRLLSTKAFVGIGLISYSAYLWHQPLFAFVRYRSLTEPSNLQYILLCFGTFFMALLTWRFVEKPFRESKTFSRNQIFTCSIVTSLIFIFIGSYGQLNQSNRPSLKWVDGSLPTEFKGIMKDGEECSYRDPLSSCKLGKLDSSLKIVIVGDSHARVLTEAAKKWSEVDTFEWIDMSASGCPFLLGMSAYVSGIISEKCTAEYQNKRLAYLSKISSSVIVLHWRFPLYISGEGFDNTIGGVEHRKSYVMAKSSNSTFEERIQEHQSALHSTINELIRLGHKVIIISGVPTNGWDPIMRLWKLDTFGLGKSHEERLMYMRIPLKAVKSELDTSDHIISAVVKNFSSVIVIDPKKLFCDSLYCASITNNKILYADRDHLSFDGAMQVFDQALSQAKLLIK